ncbi:exo-alpha-sialidase [Chitinophaga sp. S165]|uniref:exo-alpha-sialidase n=1 Tax=Chitinophaga sp. S165 TaxID=2135462 RepID=UPI000D983791|nr:exo-alpha-sialidase [Chitinophaga sp. S165]PWV50643.1 BNR repeat protein [Chitinophaga sp. S165]
MRISATICILSLLLSTAVKAQESIRYTGNTLVNVDYHHGQLRPVMGVHSIQIMRANREHPELGDKMGWTYNHAPMLAYWNKRFYVEYLSDEKGESIPPGQTLLLSSEDGYNWGMPVVLFPPYKIPDGTVKEGHPGVAKDLFAVMHQRMGFYVSKSNKLLALGFYGICLDAKDDPNDGNGIGRVVREILPDGKFGPVYFIRYNKKWNKDNTSYPFYTSSKDKAFVAACNELLATPLMTQQWNEEADRDDPLISLQKQYKAFCYYHLPDGRVVGLWKNALTSMSKDEGRTWGTVARAPGFVNSNAKIWGQRTTDGRFATVYNPSEYRWPLALSVSKDGIDYTNLLLVNGEITPMRYGGNYKSYGPQYVRGIEEGNGNPPDSNLWVTYSMNKEDIWVSVIPVPVIDKAPAHVNDVFPELKPSTALKDWNIYSPRWAPVSIGKVPGVKAEQQLILEDKDPFDYGKAERLFPASSKLSVSFTVTAAQNSHGALHVELQDGKGTPGLRLVFDADSVFKAKAGARFKNFMKYSPDSMYNVRLTINTTNRFYTINVNGKDVLTSLMFAPVDKLERIVFRTGEPRHFPDADTPADQEYDLKQAGEQEARNAKFYIRSLKTAEL